MTQSPQAPEVTTRFAPSPTGPLHLGHLLSAAFVWAGAKAMGARIILRIEDHDQGRSKKSFEDQILRDLDWLGFQADDGVTSSTAPSPFRQSDCFDRYERQLGWLRATAQAYPCYCSRSAIAEAHARSNPLHGANSEIPYPGTCRSTLLSTEQKLDPHGWRWCMPDTTTNFRDLWCDEQQHVPQRQCGDLLLRERNGHFTYQYCVVSDDVAQGINLVIRGQDLLESTGRQLLLRSTLIAADSSASTEQIKGGKTLRFLHHPLITDAAGRKLSKKDLDRSLADYRAEGYSPQHLLRAALENVPGLKKGADYAEFCTYLTRKLSSF